MLFVLTMVSYGQSEPSPDGVITLIRPYVEVSFIDDTTLMVTSSRYQTIVYESDGLEWIRLVDEINKKDYLVIKVKNINKEYRLVLLTYVYDVRQPPRGAPSTGKNWGHRLQKVYNTFYINCDNGIVSIK